MKTEPHYKIKPISPIYQIKNDNQRKQPDYKKRNDNTLYSPEKHTIDFLV